MALSGLGGCVVGACDGLATEGGVGSGAFALGADLSGGLGALGAQTKNFHRQRE